ncbi:MAG TPA: carboxypeptidase-like regulatory domain-containing protein [Bryobacteraceae bacterium]|nr:carboxypeptidase-like regulatory domain-containing protein [Bryobacteraceae bacterium]
MSTQRTVSRIPALVGLVLLCCVISQAQTVNGSIIGRLVDPGSAVVASAQVTLTNQDTGAVRTATSDAAGVFRLPDLLPGTYTVSIQVQGFKALTEKDVVLSASETRDLGTLALQIGNLTESVSVTAEATPIQLASSEQSREIDANQLANVTLKGRDLFGYFHLLPGIIDTTASRDVTSPNNIAGIYINGNYSSAKNFTVDGVTDVDTGSNGTVHYEPNIDAIQELKVLTSNYQAEFGRNAGGTITSVTKSGTRDFHGTAQWSHRHEEFNANAWVNDHTINSTTGLAANKPRYRYNVETYSIGGPVFIPKLWNRDRKKLFFFWSQEYTGQFVAGGTEIEYTPTPLERKGDFSQTFANNGSQIVITDPLNNNAPFTGNVIPPTRIDPTGFGPATLTYFPLPNTTGTGSFAHVENYFEAASATHPRRNDVLRLDPYLTSKIQGFFRYINDHDDLHSLYQGVQFSGPSPLLPNGSPPIDHPNPGHGYAGSLVETITPTLINETTVGYSWNTWSWYSLDNYQDESRSLIPNIPQLFPMPTTNPSGVVATNGYFNLLPEFLFTTGAEPYAMSYTKNQTSAGNYYNANPIWTFTDNLSKVVKGHTLKTGFYLEHNVKLQPNAALYHGYFSFATDTNNPLNTGDGFANAYLGYVDLYQQATAMAQFNVVYWNFEFYAQDNWRVSKRLTLDYGVRFYHQGPQNDTNHTFSNFNPAAYTRAAAPRIYIPGTSNGKRVAIDPGTGAVAPVAYIGLYVPNSGNPADGLGINGLNGASANTYNISYMRPAPRFGFALDLTGDGKTALRGGYGIFFNRLDGNQVYNLSGLPPYAYTPQINYTTDTLISQSGGNLIYGPPTLYFWPNHVPWNYVQNGSLDLQRQMGDWLFDLSYSFNLQRHYNLSYDVNALPLGTYFQPSNLDPTNGNRPLNDILLRQNFYGFNTVNEYQEVGNSNYNGVSIQVQHRFSHGLQMGAAYTFSHGLGFTAFTPDVPNNRSWNYGNVPINRPHNFGFNWTYELPATSRYIGKVLGAITDHWTFSGVASVISGGLYNPGFSFSSGTVPSYTGTSAVTARMNVVGNPYANVPAGAFFNPNAFALPALGTTAPSTPILGNMGGGGGLLELPHVTNFDVTLSKFIPVFGERRGLKIMVQAYNVFNHTEYSGLNSTIQFNPNTGVVTNPAAVGTATTTLPNRILAFTLRFEY